MGPTEGDQRHGHSLSTPALRDRWLAIGATGLGLVFIASSYVPDLLGRPEKFGYPLFYCGMGLVLGAFGSTATIKHKGLVITGALALAIILSRFIPVSQDRAALIEIDGTAAATSVTSNASVHKLYVAREEKDANYVLFVFESELNTPFIRLVIAFNDGTARFGCIPQSALLVQLGHIAVWQVNRRDGTIKEQQGETIASTETDSCTPSPMDRLRNTLSRLSLMGTAYAQDNIDYQQIDSDLSSTDVLRREKAVAQIRAKTTGADLRSQFTHLSSLPPQSDSSLLIIDGFMNSWKERFTQSPNQAAFTFRSLNEGNINFLISLLNSRSPEVANGATYLLKRVVYIDRPQAAQVRDRLLANLGEQIRNKNTDWDISSIRSLDILATIRCIQGLPNFMDADVKTLTAYKGQINDEADRIIAAIARQKC
jgi:hypothetical protein